MASTDNRTIGGQFELELAEELANNGFWVHLMQQSKAGQPADIIAVRGKWHTLIDCKVISDDKGFPFDRVEENQKYAMRMFTRKANELCYCAFRLTDGTVWLVSLERIETLKGRGKKRLTDNEIRNQTWSLQKWIESSKVWAENDL